MHSQKGAESVVINNHSHSFSRASLSAGHKVATRSNDRDSVLLNRSGSSVVAISNVLARSLKEIALLKRTDVFRRIPACTFKQTQLIKV